MQILAKLDTHKNVVTVQLFGFIGLTTIKIDLLQTMKTQNKMIKTIKQLTLISTVFMTLTASSQTMTHKMVELDQFQVVGISVRTTNQNEQSKNDIGNLFTMFTRLGLVDKIPNKKTSDIYCIYTDYEGDFNAPYTVILGCKVLSIDQNLANGFVGKTIPKTQYQVYKSTGKLPDCVGETWNKIWKSDIDRKYVADFDLYGAKSQDPNHAEVATYVSVK